MGISYEPIKRRFVATYREQTLEATFDASYTAGGEALDPGDANLGHIQNVTVESVTTDSGYVVQWDDDAGTLVVREGGGAGAPLAEIAGGTDLTGETVRLRVRGGT